MSKGSKQENLRTLPGAQSYQRVPLPYLPSLTPRDWAPSGEGQQETPLPSNTVLPVSGIVHLSH